MESYTSLHDEFGYIKASCNDCHKVTSFTHFEYTQKASRPRCCNCGSISLRPIYSSGPRASWKNKNHIPKKKKVRDKFYKEELSKFPYRANVEINVEYMGSQSQPQTVINVGNASDKEVNSYFNKISRLCKLSGRKRSIKEMVFTGDHSEKFYNISIKYMKIFHVIRKNKN